MDVSVKKMAYQEFLRLEIPDEADFQYELLNGELVKKNAPTGKHQFAQSELFYKMMHFVTEKNLGRVFSSPTAVVLSDNDAPLPDLIFLSKAKMKLLDPEWGIMGAPDLVVEIVSPSSYKRDHYDKKKLYAASGIPEYWLIDPSNQSIEVLTLKDGSYQLHAFADADGEVTSLALKDFTLKAKTLFLADS
jgi:Uma2 family endonuclease